VSETCEICRMPAHHLHHVFSGISNRSMSTKYDFTMYVCYRCHKRMHDSPYFALKYKIMFQKLYEKKYGTRDQFIKEFGRSWILDD